MKDANEEALRLKAQNTELLKIKVNPEDVKFLVAQLELDTATAERMLRLKNNDVKAVVSEFITPSTTA